MVYELMDRLLRGRGSDEAGPLVPENSPAETRRKLLRAISEFILEHRLEVSPENLAAACSAVSGSAPWLARSIAAQQAEGKAITAEWLQSEHSGHRSQDDRNTPARLAEELDRSLDEFARNSGSAREATGRFSSELNRQVARMAEAPTVLESHNLAALATQMSERARLAEAQLRESEREAQALRDRLDHARRDAERDHLTGLPNRRAFEFVFKREYEEAQTAGEALSVAFCDVDHFKHVNDRHGHDTGDRILKFIADTLAAISSNRCHVARHGGEEFVLLFRGYSIEDAAEKLNCAREDLAGRKLVNRHTDEPIGQISFSAGLADVWRYGGRQSALRAADEALLCAKRCGRNQVVIASADGHHLEERPAENI